MSHRAWAIVLDLVALLVHRDVEPRSQTVLRHEALASSLAGTKHTCPRCSLSRALTAGALKMYYSEEGFGLWRRKLGSTRAGAARLEMYDAMRLKIGRDRMPESATFQNVN